MTDNSKAHINVLDEVVHLACEQTGDFGERRVVGAGDKLRLIHSTEMNARRLHDQGGKQGDDACAALVAVGGRDLHDLHQHGHVGGLEEVERRVGDQVVEDAADVAQQFQPQRRGVSATAVLTGPERVIVVAEPRQHVRLLRTRDVAAESAEVAGARLGAGFPRDVLRADEAALAVVGDDGGAVEEAERGVLLEESVCDPIEKRQRNDLSPVVARAEGGEQCVAEETGEEVGRRVAAALRLLDALLEQLQHTQRLVHGDARRSQSLA